MTHVYFVPGMAAGSEIFKNINLPKPDYQIHILEWLIPENNESLANYAARMASRIDQQPAILVGVSFGGVVVQEMASFCTLKKLFIISSVKCRKELPKRIKIASLTKLYKLVPTRLANSVDDFTKLSVGPRSKKRLRLYNEYLSVRDKRYLDWAIHQMVNWSREEPDINVIHIHGNQDAVFPIRYINNANLIDEGTHVMILNKGSKISKMLLSFIENH